MIKCGVFMSDPAPNPRTPEAPGGQFFRLVELRGGAETYLLTPNRPAEKTQMDMPNTGDIDIQAQLKYLREQIDRLINERAMPHLSEMADQLSTLVNRAEEVAKRSYDAARSNVDTVSDHVKEQPVAAVLIAAAAGFLLGRMFR